MDTAELISLVESNHKAVVERFETTQKALAENQKALAGTIVNIADMQQKMARRQMSGGPVADESWGKTIVESAEFKAFKEGGARGQQRLEIENKAVTIISSVAGGMIAPLIDTSPTMLPKRRMTVRALLAPGNCTGNSVWFSRQTGRTNSAATVSEGAAKPQSDAHFSQIQTPVQTIAHYMQCSRNALDDAPALQSQIDAELRFGLAIKEEDQLLTGDGTGTNLLGLIPSATAYSAPYAFGAGETGIDRLALAILQAELSFLPCNGIVLHPTDWTKMKLTKNTQGNYILGDPGESTVPQIWGLPVVPTAAISAGSFLVGAFSLSAQIFDRMAVEILLSTEAGTNFTTNQITIRGEERLALAVRQPLGLITGNMP